MWRPSSIRALLALGITLAAGIGLLLLIFASEAVLHILELLRSLPLWVSVLYFGLLALIAALVSFFLFLALRPFRRGPKSRTRDALPPPEAEGELRARIETARELGAAVDAAERELGELDRRRAVLEVYIALFGSISVGKSALVRALVPDAEVAVDPRGGTTRQVTHYRWTSPEGTLLQLSDLPGLHEVGGELDQAARDEAARAHLVLYVCDGDLTRDQFRELGALQELGKPLLLVLNKVDRLSSEDLAAVRARLHEHLGDAAEIEVAAISAGGEQEVIRVHPEGKEELIVRRIPAEIEELAAALDRQLQGLGAQIHIRRDRSVVGLAAHKLDAALQAHRRAEAEELVRHYTKRAIVGALAAVTPGTDLLIQGFLGIRLVRELSALYGRPAKDVDAERFVRLASQHLGKTLPLLLAVSGNVLKAFPGVGTVTGSLVHAVAYGLVFESLGKSVALTLDQFGELETDRAVELFEDKLGEDVEARARRFLRYALEADRIRLRARGRDAGAD